MTDDKKLKELCLEVEVKFRVKKIKEMYFEAEEKFKAKKFDEALELIDELKRMEPEFKFPYLLEVRILEDMHEYPKAINLIKELFPRYDLSDPSEKDAASNALELLASAYWYLGISEESMKCFKLSAQITIDENSGFVRYANAIYTANMLENFSQKDFRVLYGGFNKYLANILPYPKKFYTHKRIRVGFMSADFRDHTVTKWSAALLMGLDKNLFNIYCYSNVQTPDQITEYIRSFIENWRDIKDLTDKKAAELIRKDEIDILFDLSGYTAGGRLQVAAYHPASVQMSGIGYMNSTGLDCFDYFLSDVYCAGDESYFTEKLIKLPHSHIYYETPIKVDPADSPPCLKNNFVTFGSFNNFGKVTESILIAWKKILDAVPESRLILKHVAFNTDGGKKFVGERLKNLGFDLSRVEMRPFSANHLVEYGDVDIALDTFPYTGGVTTCEALYMGVPVISLYGDRHGTRFGLSILNNIGLGEMAVDSYEKYINLAVVLSRDKDLLLMFRKNLRMMMEKSPLMNAQNYVHEVEQAFTKILEDERKVFEAST